MPTIICAFCGREINFYTGRPVERSSRWFCNDEHYQQWRAVLVDLNIKDIRAALETTETTREDNDTPAS